MLDTVAPQMLGIDHPSPFHDLHLFEVKRLVESVACMKVVHEDGTARRSGAQARNNKTALL